MRLALYKESVPGETRVALIPAAVRRLVQSGLEVVVQRGAGEGSLHPDAEYEAAGARVTDEPEALRAADLFVRIHGSSGELPEGKVLVAILGPLVNHELMDRLAGANVTAMALDVIPRITRAQSMDVLSSMSTVAGYRAVLLGAGHLRKMIPMLMTAAGTIRPAGVLVIGAGVAGLQAIATAKRIGAIVTGVDVRPAAREQVESLGAKFAPLEVDHSAEAAGGYAADLGEAFYRQEQEILAPHVKASDLIVTTALIPGRPAPVLLTEAMVADMKGGSVVVDLAAGMGGNCTLTRPDEVVQHGGVTILGPTNLPADLPIHASEMFSRNVEAYLKEIVHEGALSLNMENEIIAGTLITHQGRIVHPPTLKAMGRSEG